MLLEIQPLLTLLCEEEMGSFVHKPLINGKDTISLNGVRSLIEIVGKKQNWKQYQQLAFS